MPVSSTHAATEHARAAGRPSPVRRLRMRLSLRLVSIFGLTAFLMLLPVWRSADIVAAVLSTILVAIVTCILLSTIISTVVLRRSFHPEILLPRADPQAAPPTALQTVSLLLRLPPIQLWPLTIFEWRLKFREANLTTTTHRSVSPAKSGQSISENIIFPHRGEWVPEGIHCAVKDQFGLLEFSWIYATEELHRPVRIHPYPESADTFPILSSCERAGDEVTHLQERRGDYFDFKPYHPSDGVKRIIWKIYARSGELVARQPEAAMTPEGEVVVWVLADPRKDTAASTALAYVERLTELELEIVAAVASTNLPAVKTALDLRDLLIESTWDIRLNDAAALTASAAALCKHIQDRGAGEVARRVVVFVAPESLANLDNHGPILQALQKFQESGMTPVILMAQGERSNDSRLPSSSGTVPESDARRPTFRRFFIRPELEMSPESIGSSNNLASQFFQECAKRGWDVLRQREEAWQ